MKIIADKIASVTRNIALKNEIEISKKIISKEGYVIAVEVLNDKTIYNKLELTSGRMSTIHKGDVLVVALGNRRALKGYVGEVPSKIKQGDIINLLNLGGVAGICTSENIIEVGPAMQVKVLGALIDKNKKHYNIYDYRKFDPDDKITNKILPPIIIISGTCMDVGKTSVACEIIKEAYKEGLHVNAAKVAGIAALKDTNNMEDYGAKETVSMIDAGFPSTVNGNNESVKIAKGAINYLSKFKPDLIVMELGDGIFGNYGVLHILMDKEFKKIITAHIGCAYDPPGASKLYEVCRQIETPLHLISGPVTDNSVGKNFIKQFMKVKALNSLTQGKKIFPEIKKTCFNNHINLKNQ